MLGQDFSESDIRSLNVAISKHSTILGKVFRYKLSPESTTMLKTCFHGPSLQSTCGFMLKMGFGCLRSNTQDKGLGRMTKINIKVWASQMCPGHTDSAEVTKATSHPSLLNRKHGISLSLKKQTFVFNTPGFPGAYL